ncbi:hypothetical protein [Ruania rhizosphaerae]|uniref:hypothetical protein n=1 Tax=Ruania rhizosphaerae TaxID=1840413 RepID=UPI00135C0D10|nr:hypothetical protein [Ruania rhizosphaerae]
MTADNLKRRTVLQLGAAGAAAGTAGTLLGAPAAYGASDPTAFTLGEATGKVLAPTDFAFNAPFQFTGLYHGTLPASDPRSKRTQFAEALQQAGVQSLRFPGGTPALLYIPQGEAHTEALVRDLADLHPEEAANKHYQPDRWSHNYYVRVEDFLEFCEEFGFEPIYQVNTAFYYDASEQRTWAMVPNRWVVRRDGSVVTEYFDRLRIAEAADALDTHIGDLLSQGFNLRYWEIGNEEFAQYDTGRDFLNEGNDDGEIENYARVVVELGRVIRARVPESTILIGGTRNWRGNPWNVPLLEAIDALDGLDVVDHTTSHYPFSRENRPDTSDQPLEDFVSTDMGIVTNMQNARADLDENGFPHIGVQITETSAYRLPHWNGRDVTATFAHGLVWAHNFGQLMFETESFVNAKHDLESPFFGGVMYNVVIDPAPAQRGKRNFRWIGPDGEYSDPLVTDPEEIPEDHWFRDEYYTSPQMKMCGLFSGALGGRIVAVTPGSLGQDVSMFAALVPAQGSQETLMAFVVNRSSAAQDVSVTFPESGFVLLSDSLETQSVSAGGQWGLAGALSGEYSEESGSARLSRARGSVSSFDLTVPGYSFTRIAVRLGRRRA